MEEASNLINAKRLAQGTIFPDIIESVGAETGTAHLIKSHHNVGGLTEHMIWLSYGKLSKSPGNCLARLVERFAYLHYSANMQIVTIQPEDLFQALADQTRLRIVRLLATAQEEACLCELVDSLQEPPYKLSRHLKILRQSGLLSAQKEGRWVYHRLVTQPAYLMKLVTAVCALPDPERVFEADLVRFGERMCLRENGRCRVGILSDELKAEAR